MVKGVTGLDLDQEELAAIAKSVTDNTRRFNLREGLTRQDDELPPRFTGEALADRQAADVGADELMLDEYYEERGWDKNGRL